MKNRYERPPTLISADVLSNNNAAKDDHDAAADEQEAGIERSPPHGSSRGVTFSGTLTRNTPISPQWYPMIIHILPTRGDCTCDGVSIRILFMVCFHGDDDLPLGKWSDERRMPLAAAGHTNTHNSLTHSRSQRSLAQ